MKFRITEIITVGRELLDGRTIDTNSVEIARLLKEQGYIPRFVQRVGDDIDDLSEAFSIAERRSNCIIVTGGLGPTTDDLTLEAFAKFKGIAVKADEAAAQHVRERYRAFGSPVVNEHPEKMKQARLPVGAAMLTNSCGTAPGAIFMEEGRTWFFLPGVPREMKEMMRNHVLHRFGGAAFYRARVWATHFIGESDLQAAIRKEIDPIPKGLEMLFRVKFPGVHIGLELLGEPGLEGIFDDTAKRLDSLLAPFCYASGERGREPDTLEEVLVRDLKKTGTWIATMESCTGGLIAHRLTGISGASECFWGGSVVYDNLAKVQQGVDSELIEAHGAVSEPVALAMAKAQLLRTRETSPNVPLIAVSTTGIAGPTGGSPEKPVGLCYVAAATSWGMIRCIKVNAPRGLSRKENKTWFSQQALELARSCLKESPSWRS